MEIFNSPAIKEKIGTEGTASGKLLSECGNVDNLDFEKLGTNIKSLEFFDVFEEAGNFEADDRNYQPRWNYKRVQ